MDLSLSDEQKQLQESAERFVRDKYAFENRRKIAATDKGLRRMAPGCGAKVARSSSALLRRMMGIDRRDGLDRSQEIASRPGTSRSCRSTKMS